MYELRDIVACWFTNLRHHFDCDCYAMNAWILIKLSTNWDWKSDPKEEEIFKALVYSPEMIEDEDAEAILWDLELINEDDEIPAITMELMPFLNAPGCKSVKCSGCEMMGIHAVCMSCEVYPKGAFRNLPYAHGV